MTGRHEILTIAERLDAEVAAIEDGWDGDGDFVDRLAGLRDLISKLRQVATDHDDSSVTVRVTVTPYVGG